jgi:hypothetical protein
VFRSAEGRSESPKGEATNLLPLPFAFAFAFAFAFPQPPKNKSQNRDKFLEQKNRPPKHHKSPRIHHNFTTIYHLKNTRTRKIPLQKRPFTTSKKSLIPSNIFSYQTATDPYYAPTP